MDGHKKITTRAEWKAPGVGQMSSSSGSSLLIPGMALAAFLLGNCPLPFATYPLGLALLCASTQGTLAIAAGLVAACFTLPLPRVLTLSVTLGTLAVRVLVRLFIDLPDRTGERPRLREVLHHLRGRLFCEALYLRMACVCVSVFTLSLYAMIRGGFRYYDLFGAVFSTVTAPIAVFLFSGLFEGELRRLFEKNIAEPLESLAHIAFVGALCYSLADTALAGIPLGTVFAFVAVLILCRRRGLITAILAGALAGISVTPAYMLILPLSATAAYCVFDTSAALAAAVACIAGTVCGTWILGGESVSLVFLPLFCGTAIFCTLEKVISHGATEAPLPLPQERPPSPTDKEAHSLADTLDELSEVLKALGKQQKKPSADDLRLLCDSCFDRLCPDCERHAHCWEHHYHVMLDSTDRLVRRLSSDPAPDEEALADLLAVGCCRLTEMTRALSAGLTELSQKQFCSEKAEIFARDYANTATLLRELCEQRQWNSETDDATAAAISARIRDLGFSASRVSVTGRRQKTIELAGIAPLPVHAGVDYFVSRLEPICSFPLCDAHLSEDGHLTAHRAPCATAVCGSSFSAHEGVCGDEISLFSHDGLGMQFALINDGMGAGKEAAFTAKLASLFLRKLLPVGISPKTALRMLNHFLRRGQNVGSTEVSTTVDLLMLDLLLGRATFIKSGAAPTYVKRGKNIFYLDAKTAPLGILSEIDAKQIDFEVKHGDLIVMVSDGITDGNNECVWLLDLLDTTTEQDPTVLARRIVASASERGCTDDLSAVVLRVEKTG